MTSDILHRWNEKLLLDALKAKNTITLIYVKAIM